MDPEKMIRRIPKLGIIALVAGTGLSIAIHQGGSESQAGPAAQQEVRPSATALEVWTDPVYGCEYIMNRTPQPVPVPRMRSSPVGGTVQVCRPPSPPPGPTAAP